MDRWNKNKLPVVRDLKEKANQEKKITYRRHRDFAHTLNAKKSKERKMIAREVNI